MQLLKREKNLKVNIEFRNKSESLQHLQVEVMFFRLHGC